MVVSPVPAIRPLHPQLPACRLLPQPCARATRSSVITLQIIATLPITSMLRVWLLSLYGPRQRKKYLLSPSTRLTVQKRLNGSRCCLGVNTRVSREAQGILCWTAVLVFPQWGREGFDAAFVKLLWPLVILDTYLENDEPILPQRGQNVWTTTQTHRSKAFSDKYTVLVKREYEIEHGNWSQIALLAGSPQCGSQLHLSHAHISETKQDRRMVTRKLE